MINVTLSWVLAWAYCVKVNSFLLCELCAVSDISIRVETELDLMMQQEGIFCSPANKGNPVTKLIESRRLRIWDIHPSLTQVIWPKKLEQWPVSKKNNMIQLYWPSFEVTKMSICMRLVQIIYSKPRFNFALLFLVSSIILLSKSECFWLILSKMNEFMWNWSNFNQNKLRRKCQ